MSSGAPARRLRLEADDRREQILVAAERLFAERSYEAVSTTELAQAAGTTRTNLHYYFGTKRALYLDVIRRFAQLPGPPKVVEVASVGDLAGDVGRLFNRWLDVVEDHRETYLTMLLASSPRTDPEVAALLRESIEAWADRLIAVTGLRDVPAHRAAIRSFQALVAAATDEWLRRGTLTRDQVHQLLTGTLLAIAPDRY